MGMFFGNGTRIVVNYSLLLWDITTANQPFVLFRKAAFDTFLPSKHNWLFLLETRRDLDLWGLTWQAQVPSTPKSFVGFLPMYLLIASLCTPTGRWPQYAVPMGVSSCSMYQNSSFQRDIFFVSFRSETLV